VRRRTRFGNPHSLFRAFGALPQGGGTCLDEPAESSTSMTAHRVSDRAKDRAVVLLPTAGGPVSTNTGRTAMALRVPVRRGSTARSAVLLTMTGMR
jgi:hypothetical protein